MFIGEFSPSRLLFGFAALFCDLVVARRRVLEGLADTLPLAFRKAISSSAISLSRCLLCSLCHCNSWQHHHHHHLVISSPVVDCIVLQSASLYVCSSVHWKKTCPNVTKFSAAYISPDTRKQGSCLEKEIMQRTMPGARRRERPHTAWMENINTWTGLSVKESIKMTEDGGRWRTYVHGVGNPQIEDG